MSQEMADLFRSISSGVYVIGVAANAQANAFTAAWVMPVSFQPLLLALSINPNNSSYQLLKTGGVFSVNVLQQHQLDLAKHFGQPSQGNNKLAACDWSVGESGAPLLKNMLAYFECKVVAEYTAGDHRLITGQVVNGRLQQPASIPLNYRDIGDMDGASNIYPANF